MKGSPQERYRALLDSGHYSADAAQAMAVEFLQDLYLRLSIRAGKSQPWWRRWLGGGRTWGEPEQGLYLWGGVGRGKTWLMDHFYESLPFKEKHRVHFHRFMREIHQQLKAHAGVADPLEKVAGELAKGMRVLCFDEFFVSDIADAMLLGTLLQALFARGVTLVATSNIAPDGLYKDGLQRANFLPAIALLKRHTRVLEVDGGTDFRLRALRQAELYFHPLGEATGLGMERCFRQLVPDEDEICADVALQIEGRSIIARFEAEDVAWFNFDALCDGPRSQNDYIQLACEYHAVLVSDVPILGSDREDSARRFINLVDEFYDRGVKLVIGADAPIEKLYRGQRLEFEFQRTVSRLLEMRSEDYLACPHRAE